MSPGEELGRSLESPPSLPPDLRRPWVTGLVFGLGYLVLAGLWIVFGASLLQGISPSVAFYLQTEPRMTWALALLSAILVGIISWIVLRRRSLPVHRMDTAFHLLHAHLDQSPLAVVEWDRELRVRHWSRGARKLFGWSEEEARGKAWTEWDLVHPDDREEIAQLLRRVRNDGPGGAVSVHRNIRADGEAIWCEWHTSWVRDRQGRLASFLSFAQDITHDRTRLEEIRNLNRELELQITRRTRELGQAKRDVLALTNSISRDLRAPVRALIGFTETLRDNHEESLSAEGRKYLVYLLAAGRQVDHLIEGLMEYARLGSRGIDFRPVDAGEVTRHAVDRIRDRFPEAEAAISLPRTALSVHADPDILERIMVELLENALRYRESDRPPRVEVTAHRHADEIQIRVRDNGTGIPRDERARVFRLFERLHSQDNHPGTGMGLAVVRKGVGLMGGEVTIEDQDGPGTTFLLRFPSRPDLAPAMQPLPYDDGSQASPVETGSRQVESAD
jgi:PAS domain S-box-containing protein